MRLTIRRISVAVWLGAAAAMVPSAASAATVLWNWTAGDRNWSTAGNWTGGIPASTNAVIFGDTDAQTGTSPVNTVNANTTVSSLSYTNSSPGSATSYQNTTVASGRTLTITNGLDVGAGSVPTNATADLYTTVTVAGGGGKVAVTGGNVAIGHQSNTSASYYIRALLDLRGLAEFSYTNAAGAFSVAGNYQRRQTGEVYLAGTNSIVASALTLGTSASGVASSHGKLHLGSTNSLFADILTVGRLVDGSLIDFQTGLNNPSVKIRGKDGVSAVGNWYLGWNSAPNQNASYGNSTNDFSGGILDASVTNLYVGYMSGGAPNGARTAIGNFILGTNQNNSLVVQNLFVALNSAASGTNTGATATGTLVVRGGTVTATAVTLAQPGNYLANGTLTLSSGASMNVSGSITSGGTSTISVSDATLNVGGVMGSPAANIGTLNLSNATLGLTLTAPGGYTNAAVFVGALNIDGLTNSTVIKINSTNASGQYPLIAYTSVSGAAGFSGLSVQAPPGVTVTLSNNVSSYPFTVDAVIQNLAEAGLVFTTAPFTQGAGVLSGPITVQLQTGGGTPINTTSNLMVTLSTTSAGGVFRDVADTTTVTSVVIPVGSSSASFKYKDTTALATPTLTASAGVGASATQQVTIVGGSLMKLGFTTPPANGYVGVTLPAIVVQVEDVAGNPVPQSGTAVTLTLNGGTLASGTTTQTTDASGQATFNDLLIMAPGGGLTFTATATGFPPLTSGTFAVFSRSGWDIFTLVLQPTNGHRVPRVIGASGSIDSAKGFSGFDYFEWFGITHHRYWIKPSFSPLNPTGGVTDVASFDAARAAVRANPWRQGTSSDVYYDWNRFYSEIADPERHVLHRFGQLGIVPMLCNTVFTDQDPLADWGNKFKYWKFWYAYVYFFASQYNITMYEFRNEANAWGSYAQWESHWLVCADAMRKAMADVNANYGRNLKLDICGPTMPGPWWDYSLPDPDVDPHGWGSVAWKKIQTDIYGNVDTNILNYGVYDYHRYSTDATANQNQIINLRQDIATASNAPNSTIPLNITEYNTSTGGNFTSRNLDTEDLNYGIATAGILEATVTRGMNGLAGLGDEGGFFLFKLGARDGDLNPTLQNRTAYVSNLGDYNYGGVTRGGVCFQLYARHFRGGKPLLGYNVTSGSSSKRRSVAVLDEQNRAYYLYFSNVNGTNTTVSLDLSALEVQPGAPVTVARVDTNNTGQITDYLSVDAARKLWFNVPHNTAVLVWVPQGNSAPVLSRAPTNDTYLVVGQAANRGAEPSLKVSLHHSTASERRIGYLQFNLGGLTLTNRYLLRLCGRNIGTDQNAREILHLYGAGGASWSETNLTWATAPGVGKYYTSTNTMATTTGLGSMVDIEDNYRGTTTTNSGKGLGLHGKFLGPVSFYSPDWATNYVDVTDYVKSLISSNQTQATFVIARIVRYDVNQYSNSYYMQGVYDYNGRIVEIASKENSNPASRPALLAWPRGIVASVATYPTNITAVVSNSILTLSWPVSHLGWILQGQTNHAGLGTNWVDVGGSSGTSYNIPISPANPSVFFRLRSP